jgi:sulfite exporter TauE/SafE
MAAFGLATVPALAALGLGVRRLAGRRPWSRRVLAVLVLVAGLWVVFQRQGMTPERMMEKHAGAAVQDSVAHEMP